MDAVLSRAAGVGPGFVVVLLGDPRAMAKAAQNADVHQLNSKLGARLRAAAQLSKQ